MKSKLTGTSTPFIGLVLISDHHAVQGLRICRYLCNGKTSLSRYFPSLRMHICDSPHYLVADFEDYKCALICISRNPSRAWAPAPRSSYHPRTAARASITLSSNKTRRCSVGKRHAIRCSRWRLNSEIRINFRPFSLRSLARSLAFKLTLTVIYLTVTVNWRQRNALRAPSN